MKIVVLILAVIGLSVLACDFSQYAQTENLTENIDTYRTGCEVDVDTLMTNYKQYEANRFYIPSFSGTPNPTSTPRPISDSDIVASTLLEQVWEHGCQTGRRDSVGAEQVTLMSLRDQLNVLGDRISALEPTVTPTPVATTGQ